MSGYFQWLILTAITGSPLGSAAFLLFFWLVVDRLTLGLLPDPLRWLMRRRREGQLRRTLLANPNDRRARLELAGLYVDRGAGKQAVEVLRPNLENGDDDVQTVFTMGAACMKAGYFEQGEKLLAHAQELDPDFRLGEIDLVLGQGRLAKGDFAGAKAALEALLKHRRGTIQGRVLLARALEGLGDDASAALMKDEAWREYVAAPGFQRRKERLWAWRARPSRPVTYALVLLAVLVFLGTVVAPKVSAAASEFRRAQGGVYFDPSLDDGADDIDFDE
jgi:tetratricopeptide (TPR) repeat protein